ncbi:MAG: hypothetical protein J5621_07390 [Paludibacteraceae bacterium]|nr:hypothetical protein [Paludibacteraceae bacterium]
MLALILTISLSLLSDLIHVGGNPHVEYQEGAYERIALTDSTTLEVYKSDSIAVVLTVCAPQCSSCARIYNKEWQLIRNVEPTVQSIFPLATIDKETGKITWTDNDTWEY